ncbi:MAG: outer membrane protein assembly factor BamE [Primorskyibacter sp.]
MGSHSITGHGNPAHSTSDLPASRRKERGALRRMAVVIGLTLALSACSEQVRTHGFAPTEAELQNILPGVDTRDTIEETIGIPTTSGVANKGAYYYIESTLSAVAWRASRVVDRKVVEITFDDADVVENISVYGLADGRVVRISRRMTRSGDGNISFIRQLFGNIGGFGAEQILGSGT